MTTSGEPSRGGTRPPASTAQVTDARLRALVVQERALSFYAHATAEQLLADAGRHARAARALIDELVAGCGTEIHEGG